MIPIDENDVVMNLRFQFCYSAHEGIDFQDKWVNDLIVKKFEKYTFRNHIRINKINAVTTGTVVFDVQVLNISVAPQDIADDILNQLHDAVSPAFHGIGEEMWRESKILSIGDEKEMDKTLKEYLKKIRKRN